MSATDGFRAERVSRRCFLPSPSRLSPPKSRPEPCTTDDRFSSSVGGCNVCDGRLPSRARQPAVLFAFSIATESPEVEARALYDRRSFFVVCRWVQCLRRTASEPSASAGGAFCLLHRD